MWFCTYFYHVMHIASLSTVTCDMLYLDGGSSQFHFHKTSTGG